MAERYEDQHRRDQGYRREDRGFMDRAGDEVRSWFGDDDAERRRQMDDREHNRDRGYQGGHRGYQGDRGYGGNDRGYGSGGGHDGYYDRGSYSRPVTRDSLGDRGQALSDQGYGDRSYGGYTDRAFSQTYDRGSSYGGDRPDGSGRSDGWRDRQDRNYRSDGWQGMNHPASQTYGNRDQGYSGRDQASGSQNMPWGRDERSSRDFTGQGPRGYQRSDSRINEDVCDCLCDSRDVDARNIEVVVSNGEVTLIGSVSDREQKRRAEDLIEQVSGVREVHNNLKVNKGEWSGGTSGAAGSTGQSNAEGQSGTAGQSSTTRQPGTAGSSAGSATPTAEQPGNVLGVDGGAPDTASPGGRR